MIDVSVLGYKWTSLERMGWTYYIHLPILRALYSKEDVTHLAIQYGDWVVHPFTNKVQWVTRRVSDRAFGPPSLSIPITEIEDDRLLDITMMSKYIPVKKWTVYAWFYSFGLLGFLKQDCVSFTRKMLNYSCGIDLPFCVLPSTLLRSLKNHGY